MCGLLSVGTDNKNTHVKLCTSLAFIMLRCNKEVCFLRTPCVQVWHWMLLMQRLAGVSIGLALVVHPLPSSGPRRPILRLEFCFFTVRAGSDS